MGHFKYSVIFVILLFFTGCIYVTPEAKKIGAVKSFNSTNDASDNADVQKSQGIQDFVHKKAYISSYVIKAVERTYDGCEGCMDYVSASASAIRAVDSDIPYPTIVALSGAARLGDRNEEIEEFFAERVGLYGFTPYFASSKPTEKLTQFYKKYGIISDNSSIGYLKSLIYSGAVQIVSVDAYYILDEQSLRYESRKNITRGSGEIFVAVTGYDSSIKINDPTVDDIRASYQDIDTQKFLEGWNSDANTFGRQFELYLLRTHAETEDSIDIIKKDIKSSHDNLLKYKSILNSINKDEVRRIILQGYATRKALSEYYEGSKDRDNSRVLRESSAMFKSLINEKDLNIAKIKFDEIMKKENELKWE